MNIKIGENIKRLRLEKGITQEQLSEILGVSTVAVSKWERGENLPDISLLPKLAYYFGTTTDELLSYDACAVELDIQRFVDEHTKQAGLGHWDMCRELSKKAIADFPNDFRVMELYMWDIAGGYADNDNQVILANAEELENYCRRILDGCSDAFIRNDAIVMKGKLLHAKGRTAEAVQLYQKELPDWFQAAGQKCEQLFEKNTPEFAAALRKNMAELARLLLNKKAKEIWFCEEGTVKEKAERAAEFCRALKNMEDFFNDGENRDLIKYFAGDFACKLTQLAEADKETVDLLAPFVEN